MELYSGEEISKEKKELFASGQTDYEGKTLHFSQAYRARKHFILSFIFIKLIDAHNF